MSLLDAWQQRNPREKLILGGAALILIALVYYLFVLEPLAKKTQQLQSQADALTQQLPEIRQLASAIQNSGGYAEAIAMLENTAEQTQQNGNGTIYMTKPLPEADAKALFQTLYSKGKTQLIQQDNGVIVWHHAE